MKKLISAALLVAALFTLAACGSGQEPEEPSAYMANPWVDCATLEDAARLAGFVMAVPDRIEGYPNTYIQAIEDYMIQVFYCVKDPGDGDRVLLRKGVGTEDISGDYGEYAENEVAALHGVVVTLKGEDGLVYTAVWTRDGYSYAISADAGMSREQIEDLVELVK